MKNFFKEHSWLLYVVIAVLLFAVIIGACVEVFYECFLNIWEFSRENIWLLIFNILSIPFAIFGGVSLARGGFMLLEKDGKKFGFYKHWHGMAYLIALVIGYMAFFYWITQYTI